MSLYHAQQFNAARLLQNILTNFLIDDAKVQSFFPFVLETIIHHRLLSQSTDASTVTGTADGSMPFHKWCTRINSLLHSKVSGARWAGICLIKVSIEQSHDLYLENLGSWCSALLSLLAVGIPNNVLKPEPLSIHEAAINTLSIMFGKTQDKSELQREITSIHLPKFNTSMMNLCANRELLVCPCAYADMFFMITTTPAYSPAHSQPTIFPALSRSVTAFPTTFRPIADNCKKLCLTFLDGAHDNNPLLVQSATQCLATLNHAGGKASSAELWIGTTNRLIGSVHVALDRLLDSIEEESKLMDTYQSFEMPPVSPDYVIAFPILFNRVNSLNEAICSMLSANDHLVPHLRLFSSILLRLLSQNRNRRSVRSSVYHLVVLCLEKFGIGMVEMTCNPLLNALLEDIRMPERKSAAITANLRTSSGKKSNKKRKAELTNSDALAVADTFIESPTLELQVAAFEVLKQLLMVGGSAITPSHRSSIDSLLISRLLLLSQGMSKSDDQYHLLIKLKIYECLLASVLAPSETQASVLPYALRLFSAGQNEQSGQIRSFCSQALTICDLIIHSRLPPIQRSVTIPISPVYVPGFTLVTGEREPVTEAMDENDERSTSGTTGAFGGSSFPPTSLAVSHKPQATIVTGFSQQVSAGMPVVALVAPSSSAWGKPQEVLPEATLASSAITPEKPLSTITESKSEWQTPVEPKKPKDDPESRVIEEMATIPAAQLPTKLDSYSESNKRMIPEDFAEPSSSSSRPRQTRAASDDEDEDFEIPEIDMEGPDSDVETDDP
ncbi:rRNA processing/ribosome biogenesis-domain-containing protein [Jimgerdemannia flammicorona]|uniref:Pre-rRNA-processing protein RIX1 n=1 Tax=Jimgerdemannia flammicorona TaxID=994334 RepID=A0A433QF12_9FUNG|nr:rRNA processing/ribosome biogenesis-domain-containing protein [Jimgerdemannia flammicorona]